MEWNGRTVIQESVKFLLVVAEWIGYSGKWEVLKALGRGIGRRKGSKVLSYLHFALATFEA